MDSSIDRLDIFQIYRRYCGMYYSKETVISLRNESKKARSLWQLLQQVESRVDRSDRMPILEELAVLMSKLDLIADSYEFSRFYNFVVLYLPRRCSTKHNCKHDNHGVEISFVRKKNQQRNIPEETWLQVLAFSRCVHENLEGYDPGGAWPVPIDEFVEQMYRRYEQARSLCCNCGDSETQPIDDSLPGFKIFPGVERKLGEDLQDQEFTNDNSI